MVLLCGVFAVVQTSRFEHLSFERGTSIKPIEATRNLDSPILGCTIDDCEFPLGVILVNERTYLLSNIVAYELNAATIA